MKLKELISKNDFNEIYMHYKFYHPDDITNWGNTSFFYGVCKSKDGKLLSADRDSYDGDEEEEVDNYSITALDKNTLILSVDLKKEDKVLFSGEEINRMLEEMRNE